MSIKTLLADNKLYNYILDHSLVQNDHQKNIFNDAKNDEHSNMITAPEQVQFLALLIKMIGAKKILEVGVFRGVGTMGMAAALPKDGSLYACDITDKYLKNYQHFWEDASLQHKINLIIGPAVETLSNLIKNGNKGTFDFAYVDADKENYKNYYDLTYQLLNKGGVMIFDNMLWSGNVANSNDSESSTIAIRELNEFIKQDSRVEASLLPIGDGINIVRKK